MKSEPALVDRVRQQYERRLASPVDKPAPGATRVEVIHSQHLTFRAKVFGEEGPEIIIDEPEERGGLGKGPTPLQYFLIGSAACFMMQCANIAIARGMRIDMLRVSAIMEFDRRVEGKIKRIIYEIKVESPEKGDVIRWLVAEAERFCYVHNTLSEVVEMKTRVSLNGEVLEQTSDR